MLDSLILSFAVSMHFGLSNESFNHLHPHVQYKLPNNYRTYFPTFEKESAIKIMNTPKNEYMTTSSATC